MPQTRIVVPRIGTSRRSEMAQHQAPERIEPQSLGDYLEVMSKSVFQSGMSWRVIEAKWAGIREAFHGFDAEIVASLGPDEIDGLAGDKRVIRNRRKLEAIVDNARIILELEGSHGSFQKYLRSHGDFDSTIKDLRKTFKFLGEMGCYHFLYVVGEQVPSYEEWCARSQR